MRLRDLPALVRAYVEVAVLWLKARKTYALVALAAALFMFLLLALGCQNRSLADQHGTVAPTAPHGEISCPSGT